MLIETVAATALLARIRTNNRAALTPCTTYRRYFYNANTCFKTHPELRKAHVKKKRKREQKQDKKKKKENKTGEGKGEQKEEGNIITLSYYNNPAISFLAIQHKDPKDIPECLFIANRQTALSCSYMLDSGASVHACCRKEDFISELRPYTGKRINRIESS